MTTILDHKTNFILKNSDKIAFNILNVDLSVKRSISYKKLVDEVNNLSLPTSNFPVLLLYEDVTDFIISFLACQKAGLTSIPMFFPKSKRHFKRLQDIIIDSKCELILCEQTNLEKIKKSLCYENEIQIIQTTNFDETLNLNNINVINPISFIQYTSGSTSSPKGVIVSHENLKNNLELIKNMFGCNEDSIILSWLPFYHDMGLIGNILHSLQVGATCILLPSVSVIQSPFNWLNAISKFKATHSGGPNFIYDLCVNQIYNKRLNDLDLNSWKVAYNGSEPIKKSTIDSFITKFQQCGFRSDSYYTCYGLAESTLLVSGGKYIEQKAIGISSGSICDEVEICLFDSVRNQVVLENGEILIHGKSVTSGYLNKDNSDLFVEIDNKKFLKTGDIGTIVNKELIVTGRLKEMIIINGKNYYPYEIENDISKSIHSIEENGVIVSFIEDQNCEKPIVFTEIKKSELSILNPRLIFDEIDKLIIELLGVETYDILLFTPRKLARTSSGKLQRVKTKESYLNSDLECFLSKITNDKPIEIQVNKWINSILIEGDDEKVQHYLTILLNNKLKTSLTFENFNQNLIDLGIDSLKSVDLVNTINNDLELNIEVTTLMNLTTTVDFEDFIKNLVWMKATKSEGEEIII